MTCEGCKELAEDRPGTWLCLVDWELTKPGDECRNPKKRKESTQND